jgi:hypothetical protein
METQPLPFILFKKKILLVTAVKEKNILTCDTCRSWVKKSPPRHAIGTGTRVRGLTVGQRWGSPLKVAGAHGDLQPGSRRRQED